jgi:hypothetical protein
VSVSKDVCAVHKKVKLTVALQPAMKEQRGSRCIDLLLLTLALGGESG